MLRRFWHAMRFFAAAHVRSRDELDAALKRMPRFIVIEGHEALRAYAASLAYRGGQEAAAMEEAAAVAPLPTYIVVPTIGRIKDGYRQRPPSERRRDANRGNAQLPAAPTPDGAPALGLSTGRRRERRRKAGRRADRMSLQAGMGTVIAATSALLALLGAEWLLWPSSTPELVRGPHHEAAAPRRGVEVPLPTQAPAAPPPTAHEQFIHIVVPLLVVAALAALLFLIWQTIGPGRPVRVSWRVAYRVPGQLVIARVRTKTA